MNIPTLLVFAALVLGLVSEFLHDGRDFAGWGVVAIAIALLWGDLRVEG